MRIRQHSGNLVAYTQERIAWRSILGLCTTGPIWNPRDAPGFKALHLHGCSGPTVQNGVQGVCARSTLHIHK